MWPSQERLIIANVAFLCLRHLKLLLRMFLPHLPMLSTLTAVVVEPVQPAQQLWLPDKTPGLGRCDAQIKGWLLLAQRLRQHSVLLPPPPLLLLNSHCRHDILPISSCQDQRAALEDGQLGRAQLLCQRDLRAHQVGQVGHHQGVLHTRT